MSRKNILEEDVFEEVKIESSKINQRDLSDIISNEKKIGQKSSKLDAGKFRRFINQIRLAIDLIKDFKAKKYTRIPWRSITLIAAAILYFINPLDLIPDMLPLIGITDDALLFVAVFKSIQSDLEKYCQWKGLDMEKYF
ncbi:MAG: YkvA family protein [Ignavibacteria bacterium]